MSLFSVGGNAGFALGPILITPAVLIFGLSGTLIVADPAAARRRLPRLRAAAAEGPQRRRRRRERRPGRAADRSQDDWSAFSMLTAVVSVRSAIYFGLQSFAPIWFIHDYGASEATGNTALAAMLVAGAIGTLVGGQLVDRIGRRRVLVGSIVAQIPLLLAFMLAPNGLVAGALLAAIGFVTVMSFSVSVVMGQEYLPSRLGIASGVTLGFAIGVGGVAAALLGVLADHSGLATVMWTVARCRRSGLALALMLPLTAAGAQPPRDTLGCMTQPISADGERTRTFSWSDPLATARAAAELPGIDAIRAIAAGELPPPPIASCSTSRSRSSSPAA